MKIARDPALSRFSCCIMFFFFLKADQRNDVKTAHENWKGKAWERTEEAVEILSWLSKFNVIKCCPGIKQCVCISALACLAGVANGL